MEEEERVNALATMLQCKPSSLVAYRWENHSYMHEAALYMVLTEEEAEEKVRDAVRDSLWAFNATFIIDTCELKEGASALQESLVRVQEGCSDACNGLLESIILTTCGMDAFVKAAVAADGRGHFLSPYDGVEREESNLFIYRVN